MIVAELVTFSVIFISHTSVSEQPSRVRFVAFTGRSARKERLVTNKAGTTIVQQAAVVTLTKPY